LDNLGLEAAAVALGEPGLSRPVFKNLGFLKNLKVRILGFYFFLFTSQNFYFFMSNSVYLFELIGVASIS